ncbi:hypothetical protein MMC14_009973 [Varicellaria rhodocarpa]|nr:hypothetical protein [Varicellaria rhodocarpa]
MLSPTVTTSVEKAKTLHPTLLAIFNALMHALACHRSLAISSRVTLRSCRRIAGRRLPPITRTFRSSSFLRTPQDDPANASQPAWNHVHDISTLPEEERARESEEVIDDTDTTTAKVPGTGAVDDLGSTIARINGSKDLSGYGSALNRAYRNLKKAKSAKTIVPLWFFERNVLLLQDLLDDGGRPLTVLSPRGKILIPPHSTTAASSSSKLDYTEGSEGGRDVNSSSTSSLDPISSSTSNPDATEIATLIPDLVQDQKSLVEGESRSYKKLDSDTYEIDHEVFAEISAMISAGLCPSPYRYADSYPASRPHLVLQSPKEGGVFFLDSVVRALAIEHGADVIQIDAQDIAEIGGEHLGDLADVDVKSLRSLGYEAHMMMGRHDSQDLDDGAEDGYEEDMEDDQDQHPRNRSQNNLQPSKVNFAPVAMYVTNITDIIKSSKILGGTTSPDSSGVSGQQQKSGSRPQSQELSIDVKASLLIDTLLETPHIKRRTLRPILPQERPDDVRADSENHALGSLSANEPIPPSKEISDPGAKGIIVLIRDYAEINATAVGGRVLNKVHEIVKQRRKDGEAVLIIGTTSSQDLIPSMSKSGFKTLQTDSNFGPTRTIVTPCRGPENEDILASDEKVRIRQINLRHVGDMLLRISPKDPVISGSALYNPVLDSAQVYTSELEDEVWTFEQVHRVATVIAGLSKDAENSSEHLSKALEIIKSSDDAKFDWLAEEKEREKRSNSSPGTTRHPVEMQTANEGRIRKLRKTCNTHEKKLLNGVIDAASIKTTFTDVQAPPETIEALKTLTTLSLVRPEAFSYGVLATDKIPGLLLYGPPGTGKTLLAKAVAKESGATVLEVSGSDVYDMYVGEGEKNVKAIFTLAKKLTPCVVFIDEADAIFGSRSTQSTRVSHRELINQFLREWDGMNDMSAFIMVATNRPFDLDDAVLRRLPRRLLVDLPTEKDRQAILNIHLKDEMLDPSVSLASLASQTPFYSGSDLKNLSVAAALACVREENENALKYEGKEKFTYPEKRTLAQRHFDKAMEEISASVSEDMSSLGAIRKFDEKFGDRKGRRKKTGGYGFGTATEKEKNNVDAVRVRSSS